MICSGIEAQSEGGQEGQASGTWVQAGDGCAATRLRADALVCVADGGGKARARFGTRSNGAEEG